MILGGGIAGIQGALSLSAAGYGVHLIERSDSLGGMIPGLHRLYPLCACCKLDPRIAACQQDPNINVMLNTTVASITGSLGQFTVSLKTEGSPDSLTVGAILLAAGIEAFDPTAYEAYSYGQFPNVITSVEYEQLQKPLGPGQGIVKRPSDGRVPESIAWLQCVGSRDMNQCDAPYCSSVCCMYALKEAFNTRSLSEEIETSIFYMDMRTHGKGFEDYLNRAVDSEVRLIRSRVHTVEAIADTDDLLILYVDENGQRHEETFQMVVLSVGLKPAQEAVSLAQDMGVNLNEDQFVHVEPFRPVATNVPGVFVCGGLAGPHDIGQSIAQGAAAASEITACLEPEPFAPPLSYPEPSEAQEKDPALLFAFHLCDGMSPQMATELENCAKDIPGVAAVCRVTDDLVTHLTEELKSSGANRLVFASCTPVVHQRLIEEALKLAGLNPYLYETVDLRALDPKTASAQLRDRVRMGAARAAFISPPTLRRVPVIKGALVLGGGVSGLESALSLSKAGYPATLIEKGEQLGGHGRHVRCTWRGDDAAAHLEALMAAVEKDDRITVMTDARVTKCRGFAGNFVTTVEQNGKETDVPHGVVLLATGGEPVRTEEYLYGQNDNVYLWSELSLKMMQDPSPFESAHTAVFIQCVGSREPQRPHCSNLCCTFAVRSAIDLKEKHPDMTIYILYREMRTFGERERLYRQAREKGVVFIRYRMEDKPVVQSRGKGDPLHITVHDTILNRKIALDADFVSLQTAIVSPGARELTDIFGIELDSNGFLAESPEKMNPLDTSIQGVFMAGLAHYPKDTEESIGQAKAAAARALQILSLDSVEVGGLVAEVMPEKCAVCCTCVRTCPFHVPYIDTEQGAAYIDPGLCKGCGMCVAECPGKAIAMSSCSDQMLIAAPSVVLGGS
jgi:heterodisulfide reductase subunit A